MANINSMKAYAQHINTAMDVLGYSDEERKLKLIIEEALLDTDGYESFTKIREEVKDNKNISEYLKMISSKAAWYASLDSLKNPQIEMEHTILSVNFDLIDKAEKIQKEMASAQNTASINKHLEKTR